MAPYSLSSGIACKLIADYHAPIIPASDTDLIHLILSEVHCSALGGHLSYDKMYAAVRARFYW